MKKTGNLFLVATPIGNLKDITLRALETLKEVDEVICESTEIALRLLNHYQIKKPLIHLSDENQLQVTQKIINKLKNGKNLALISDAGTPTVSDPGEFLISQVIKQEIKIIPIPGPSAILSALITSGLPTKPFLFFGFLPKKELEKMKVLIDLKNLKINKKSPTLIFFESPNRLIKSLETIKKVLGEETKVSIAREMTKIYEEFFRGTVGEILKIIKSKKKIKGEITLIIQI